MGSRVLVAIFRDKSTFCHSASPHVPSGSTNLWPTTKQPSRAPASVDDLSIVVRLAALRTRLSRRALVGSEGAIEEA